MVTAEDQQIAESSAAGSKFFFAQTLGKQTSARQMKMNKKSQVLPAPPSQRQIQVKKQFSERVMKTDSSSLSCSQSFVSRDLTIVAQEDLKERLPVVAAESSSESSSALSFMNSEPTDQVKHQTDTHQHSQSINTNNEYMPNPQSL